MADRAVKVTVRADISNYRKAMEEAAKASERAANSSEKASKKERDAQKKSAYELAQKRKAYDQLGKGLMAYGTAVTAIGVAMLKTGIEYNSLQQRTRASLTTMLGSAKAANAQMDKLDAFARTSPFAKQVFIQAQQQMLAFGIESSKVIPYLDAIQDAVAAAGGSNAEIAAIAEIMGKISASSKITAQDLNQLGRHGINAAELIGSRMGMTGAEIREAITSGSLDATVALDALAAGMKQTYDGAAANVKNTFDGAVDRVKAAWRDLSATLAEPLVGSEGGGFLITVLNGLADFMRMIEGLPGPVKIAGAAIMGLSGATALLTGAWILGQPKLAAYNQSVQYMPQAFQRVDKAARAAGRGIKSIGWSGAAIAITALVTAITLYSRKKKEQEERIDAVRLTLDEETGAITANTRAWAVKELQEDGALQKASELGISLSEVTDAVMGSTAEYKNLEQSVLDAGMGYVTMRGAVMITDKEANKFLQTVKEKQEAIQAAADSDREAAEALGEVADEAEEAAVGMEELADVAELQASAIDEAVRALKDFTNATVGVESAQLDALDAVAKASDMIEKNGKTLDRNTQAGRDNERYLIDLAGALQAATQAEFEMNAETMGLEAAVDELGKATDLSREEFIRIARQFTETDAEAEALAKQYFLTGGQATDAAKSTDEYKDALKGQEQQAELTRQKIEQYGRNLGGLPEKVETDVTARTSRAEADISHLTRRRTTYVDVISRSAGGASRGGTFARGGLVSYQGGRQVQAFNTGGFPTGIYKGGPPIHKFAEPDTGWEAYISGKPGQERRNIDIALEALRRLGHTPAAAFNNGGVVSGGRYSSHIPRTPANVGAQVPTVNVTAEFDSQPVAQHVGDAVYSAMTGAQREISNQTTLWAQQGVQD